VVNLAPGEVERAVAESHARAIVAERPAAVGSVVFEFTHALVRQTLYEEIFAAQRIRWHQQVAGALEEIHAAHLEDHAAELAEHFAQSVDPNDLLKAVQYGRVAARRAMRVYAYAEAERQLRQALQAQLILAPNDIAARCDLLLELGEAMLPTER